MRGEYLLVEIIFFIIFVIFYRTFKLNFLNDKKALFKVAITALIIFTIWETFALWRGHWGFGEEFIIGYIGRIPIEEFIFMVLMAGGGSITFWEIGKKVAKKW